MYQSIDLKIETKAVKGEIRITVTDARHAHIHTQRDHGLCQSLTYRDEPYYFSVHVYKVGDEWVTKNPEDSRDYAHASRGHLRDASPTALETLKTHVLAAFIEDIKNKPELLVMAQNEADTIVRQRIQEKIREKKTEIEELEKELAAIGV